MVPVTFAVLDENEDPTSVGYMAALAFLPRVGDTVSFVAGGEDYLVKYVSHDLAGAQRLEIPLGKPVAAEDDGKTIHIVPVEHEVHITVAPLDYERERAFNRERRALDAERLEKYGDEATEQMAKPFTVY